MFNSKIARKAFTLIELLVVVLILGILVAVALPSYLSSVTASRVTTANNNAKVIATAVQAGYVSAGGTGSYATILAASATTAASTNLIGDLGGSVPLNPCGTITTAGTSFADYTISASSTTAFTISANNTNCAGSTMGTYTVQP